ncbi:MAG: MFS transporter [Chloroflexi bacterium]|nr:MFS transporter [Chloroflexota bacterium]
MIFIFPTSTSITLRNRKRYNIVLMRQSTLLSASLAHNFRHLYGDIFWFGVLTGSTLAFLAIYAARRGATGFQVSLLTAGPALMNLFLSLPAGRWLEGKPLIRISFWSAFWQRIGYIAIVPLAWWLHPTAEIWVIIIITLVMSAPVTFLNVGFNTLLAELVPSDWRGEVVGKRNAIFAFSTTAATLLCGQILNWIRFPDNYQIVFALGALSAGISTYHIGRLRSETKIFEIETSQENNKKPLLRLDLLRGSFGAFMLSYLAFYTFQYLPVAIFPLYYVRVMHLSDFYISLGNALFYLTMMIASINLGRVSARIGHRKVLIYSALLMGFYPLCAGLARTPLLYWVASFGGGLISGMVTGGLINRLMERTPENDRPAHMALYNIALNLGMLGGALFGPLLAGILDLRSALLVAAGLRTLAGILLLIWA